MLRREFIMLLGSAAVWPLTARAQNQANPDQTADEIGQVATLEGSATVTRGTTAASTLKVNDPIRKNDRLQTGADSSLGVTFDDETTFMLNANATFVVNEFIYQESGKGTALFNVARGAVAFVAGQVAKTGDMKITTPTATIGIRGTTGMIVVPEDGAPGAAGGEAKVKLYPDADGRVGRIEVFNPQGARLGLLSQGASAFTIRPDAGGRLTAVPFRIPPQEVARDRGMVQRLFASHNIGRQMAIRRRQLRRPNLRPPGGPQQRNPRRQPRQPNPFAPRRRP